MAAVAAACRRLGSPEPLHKTVKLYSSTETGLAVQLPGRTYPIVCDTASGAVKYDNFQGCWGENVRLDQFLQAYALERAKLEARKHGHAVIEQPLSDGSIKLTIQVAGGAA